MAMWSDLAVPLRLAVQPSRTLADLRAFVAALTEGAVRVCTPSAAEPLVVSMLQLDGDILTRVDPVLFARVPTAAARSALAAQHLAAVEAAIAGLAQLPRALRATPPLLIALFLAAQAGLAWRKNFYQHELLADLASLAWEQALAFAPLLLRLALPRLLRAGLRHLVARSRGI